MLALRIPAYGREDHLAAREEHREGVACYIPELDIGIDLVLTVYRVVGPHAPRCDDTRDLSLGTHDPDEFSGEPVRLLLHVGFTLKHNAVVRAGDDDDSPVPGHILAPHGRVSQRAHCVALGVQLYDVGRELRLDLSVIVVCREKGILGRSYLVPLEVVDKAATGES